MCTLALYLREFEDYPVVIAANRDEHFSRPSAAPQILSDEPKALGGKDLVAGGTWLGVNARGLAAGIVNRRLKAHNTVTTPTTLRSRGLLCLEALKARDASQAGEFLKEENGSRYNSFLLLIASAPAAFVVFNSGGEIRRADLAAGLHVFGNTSFTDADDGKLVHARELFSTAAVDLRAQLRKPAAQLDSAVKILRSVLSDHAPANSSREPRDAICVHEAGTDYGTVSSSLIFLARGEKKFYFYHASGPPCRAGYEATELIELL